MRLMITLCVVSAYLCASDLTVVNITQSLLVSNVKPKAPGFAIQLTNISEHQITGIVLAYGDVEIIQEFLPPDNLGLAAGAAYELRVPANAAASDVVHIQAARFADFSGEGDSAALSHVNEMTRGRLLEQRRLTALFTTLATSTADPHAAAQAALVEVESYSSVMPDGSPARGRILKGTSRVYPWCQIVVGADREREARSILQRLEIS